MTTPPQPHHSDRLRPRSLLQICAGSLRALRLMMADMHASTDMAASSVAAGDAALAAPEVTLQLRSGERPHKGDGDQQQQRQGGPAGGVNGSSDQPNGWRGLAGLGQRRVELSPPSTGSAPAAVWPASPDTMEWSTPNGRV